MILTSVNRENVETLTNYYLERTCITGGGENGVVNRNYSKGSDLLMNSVFIQTSFTGPNRKMKNTVPLRSIFLIAIFSRLCIAFEYYLFNISGEVEKENFLYYSLSHEGTILLELTSLSGDCDLYVSQNKKKPNYEPDSNCLQSATCGIDSVIIPKSFKRPISVGVFGHPSYEACAFVLTFYRIHDSRDIFNYDPYQWPLETEKDKNLEEERSSDFLTPYQEVYEEEESFFWVVIRSVFVLLIEIFL